MPTFRWATSHARGKPSVLVYGHRSFTIETAAFISAFERRLDALPVHPSHDAITDLLVDLAEVESAVADALSPGVDEDTPEGGTWRHALGLLTDAHCASAGADMAGTLRSLAALRTAVPALPVPSVCTMVQGRSAEGFSCYALYPEQYFDAARQLHQTLTPGVPVVCVGIRSIGSVLALGVASELRRAGRAVDVRSVRPHGHPFDRQLALGPRLTRFLSGLRSRVFVVVDEGPGISGSSFASVVDALLSLGVGADRIALIPSWTPDPCTLRSERGRRAFSSHRVVAGRSPVTALARDVLGCDPIDVSAGLWRPLVFGETRTRWPAMHRQHERVKFVDASPAPTAVTRFAGLGRHGRSRVERAQVLGDAGFGPTPRGLHSGLLTLDWLEGTPLRTHPRPCAREVDRFADYLSFVRTALVLHDTDDGSDLVEMVRHNSEDALDDAGRRSLDQLLTRPSAAAPRVAVDGRMLPHDWVRTAHGLKKVDALDHHADDFLPGCRDIAWDLAAATIELRFASAAQQALVQSYIERTRDADVLTRLPFFTAAYLAYRLGYTAMASSSLAGTPDGARFTRDRERYRRLLAAHVAHPRRFAAR